MDVGMEMKTHKVWLSIGLHTLVEAQRWAHEDGEIVFYRGDCIIARYPKGLVLKIAVGEAVAYERAHAENG